MSTLAPDDSAAEPPADDVLEAWIADACDGDEEAVRWLIEEHVDFVRRFLGQYVDDASSVDDLCQETFVVMHRMLPTYRRASAFSTWLLGISRNLALTFLRDHSRRLRREGRFLSECVERWRSAQLRHHADETLEVHEMRLDALKACLQGLSPAASAMIEAYYFEQEPAESIARRTNRKSGSVRMTLLRIRRTLAQCIRDKTGEDGR